MRKEKVLEIQKNNGECRIVFCNIEKFKGVCGVWVWCTNYWRCFELRQENSAKMLEGLSHCSDKREILFRFCCYCSDNRVYYCLK